MVTDAQFNQLKAQLETLRNQVTNQSAVIQALMIGLERVAVGTMDNGTQAYLENIQNTYGLKGYEYPNKP